MKHLIKRFIPKFVISWYHLGLAYAGAFFSGFPSKKLIIIGVTGTKGKSTVIEFCHKIFQEALRDAQGKPDGVASMSTIRFKINDEEKQNTLKMTMPGRFRIQNFLKEAVEKGCKYAILEVTSEGIVQSRHKFIDFKTAVFTNLEPEHIERHGSFEKYKEAKGKLFQAVKNIHILNADDKNLEYFFGFPSDKKYFYTIKDSEIQKEGQKFSAEKINLLQTGSKFFVKNKEFSLNILGEFNISNALAAICVADSEGIDLDVCKSALEKITEIPGRVNIVISEPFKVVVDYAHTPDSLEKVYQTFKDTTKKQKLICVLGSCGGGRDKWKRPKMGAIAAQMCDKIILTNEDPYDEDPNKILNDIEKGLYRFSDYEKIIDRKEAIEKALSLAQPGDSVVITGKGREPWMCVEKGKKIPWDDCEIVREKLKELK